jgi:translation initiation factor 2 gamma subunit (eIF-2gamma)
MKPCQLKITAIAERQFHGALERQLRNRWRLLGNRSMNEEQ